MPPTDITHHPERVQKPREEKGFTEDHTVTLRMRLEKASTCFLRQLISYKTPRVSLAQLNHCRSCKWRKSLPGDFGTQAALAWPPRPTGGALVSLSELISSCFLPGGLLSPSPLAFSTLFKQGSAHVRLPEEEGFRLFTCFSYCFCWGSLFVFSFLELGIGLGEF